MLSNTHHSDEEQLQALLVADEDSNEYRVAANHVENCEECRERLAAMAGPDSIDDETRNLLNAYPWDELSACRSHETNASSANENTLSLDFLSPPSHPEMLGRLGRYEIERLIGSGGMGIVLKAFDTELNRPVAIKVLAQHLCTSGPARKRFEREARAAAAVVDEHVVAIHNVEVDGTTPFIVMQFVPGESLQERVDREGPLPAKEVLRIGLQAAAGLAAAHEQGVIHRDIKPGNILLENTVDRALVTDFGLARTVDDASLTRTGTIAGTPHYMSPEQAGAEAIDHRSDLFSLGCVLYFAATGRPPFRADKAMGVLHRICTDRHRSVRAVNTDIPYEVSDLIDELLQKKPARRAQSANAVRSQLSSLLAAMQEGGRRSKFRFLRRNMYRHRKQIAAIATGVVLAAIVALAVYHRFQTDAQRAAVESTKPNESQTDVTRVGDSGERGYEAAVNDPHYSVAQQRVYEELGRFQESFDTRFDHTRDTHWNQEIKSLLEKLDQIQPDARPGQ